MGDNTYKQTHRGHGQDTVIYRDQHMSADLSDLYVSVPDLRLWSSHIYFFQPHTIEDFDNIKRIHDVMECMKYLRDVMECMKYIRDVMECMKYLHDVMECMKHIRDVMECMKHLHDVMECMKHIRDVMECMKHLRDVMECVKHLLRLRKHQRINEYIKWI